MEIDNREEAIDLNDRLTETVPFKVKAGKELLKTMRDKRERVNTETEFNVSWVGYSGDMGGIQCSLDPLDGNLETGERYVVSITHLKIDPSHPLIEELQAYQEKRTRRLKLQDQISFASEFLAQSQSPRRKPSRGFGR
jgi:hypothetical protein